MKSRLKLSIRFQNSLIFLKEIHFLLKDFHQNIFSVIDKLEIIDFEFLLFQLYPIFTKFNEAIHFIQFRYAISKAAHFQISIEIVSAKF
jgi:hypothetical protein